MKIKSLFDDADDVTYIMEDLNYNPKMWIPIELKNID